ncbi:hypothetical protein DFH09DRAFT_46559 [Mycena vulgaris]|nr:hypothetical protein DFH09DRAFT_46559 [Mycena vulgaris]
MKRRRRSVTRACVAFVRAGSLCASFLYKRSLFATLARAAAGSMERSGLSSEGGESRTGWDTMDCGYEGACATCGPDGGQASNSESLL